LSLAVAFSASSTHAVSVLLEPVTLPSGGTSSIHVASPPAVPGFPTRPSSDLDNAGGSPQIIMLSGNGTAPVVGLAPTSLGFGNQLLATTSAQTTVTLTNNGAAALTINSFAASGDFAATSTGASSCPLNPAAWA